MCYVVAKNVDAIGCVAIKMKQGPSVVALKKEINTQFAGQKIQVVTISRPSAYGEYHVLGKRATLLPFQTPRSVRSGS